MNYYAHAYADDGGFSVEFEDCPGCSAFGSNWKEALLNAEEALAGWLESHIVRGELPPRPVVTEGEPITVNAKLCVSIERLWNHGKPFQCNNCHARSFERKEIETAIQIGSREVVHTHVQEVCTRCAQFNMSPNLLALFELRSALKVLREHKATGTIASDIRRIIGLTPMDLADRLGVVQETIVLWERSAEPIAPTIALALEALVRRRLA